jgi:hypothetical protein
MASRSNARLNEMIYSSHLPHDQIYRKLSKLKLIFSDLVALVVIKKCQL